MKIAWKLIAVIVMVTFAISCTKLETTPQFPKSSASFSATASTTSVTPTATDSVNNVLTFNWTDPGYAVGLTNSKFVVMVGATGKDFVSFAQKGFSGVLTGALLGKEINAMALKFGGQVGQAVTLDVKIVASQENNNETMSSNVLQIAVTPYGDLGLKADPTKVVCAAATSGTVGTVLSWSTAFNGYTGVKTYQLQYAKGGTSFASPTSTAVTGYTKSFTQLDLNKIALGYGVVGGSDGTVDFRIAASNESGSTEYSNVVTVTITTYVANNSVGLIGDATPGGWNTDTDMYRPDPINKPADWTLTLYLIGGKSAKIRADDAWDTNWGDSAFPSGTATQNGPNIPIANSGYYKVTFNAGSGAYTFTALAAPTFANISLIGANVGTAWTTDFDLTQDNTDPHLWTGTITFGASGDVKFRANHDWGTNWGFASFPSGYGTAGGDNIPQAAGTYFVRFNDVSGEFFFGNTTNNATAPYTAIGIIGDATPQGWGADTPLIQNPINPYKWSAKVVLTGTGTFAKFRANNDWTVNWGSTTFPNGVGTQGGANIPATAGTYQVTFNSATGEYTFTN